MCVAAWGVNAIAIDAPFARPATRSDGDTEEATSEQPSWFAKPQPQETALAEP